ncbi:MULTISPECIES: TrmB family transcriptional regulator [Haloferax]|uniref:TrmB family transcriptional regulator n=1 Tax=Haloferax marinum TaxID=2666143 RepID=A0A6A8G6Z2_9EURY|nr:MULTISPECIES: TrmB family transcriptional regulator [Haloferax]KAB1197820.1 TrmB family transcriptional regulator [Haloferax sp. CBA1150]MRW96879.1 TrmB family transcriptional regulator [Haloferax marinum]
MDRDTLAHALEYADLTSYQADAYLTLLEMGTSPAIEVGRESSVPVSQVYDVLRSLESKGYVETIEREKLYVRPSDPEDAMSKLESRGELLHDAAEEVRDRYKSPARMDARVGVTKRVETAVENAQELIDDAKSVVEVAGTFEQLQSLSPALRAARKRGVIVRASVYVGDEQAERPEFEPDGIFSEVRACTIPGPFLVVIDRHRTCFAPNTRSDEDYGVLVYDRILPFVFHWFYLTCLWNLYPTVYVDDRDQFTYVTMEELIRDCLPLWKEGYELRVVVEGNEIASETATTVEGTVVDVSYLGDYYQPTRLALSDLGSYKNVTLETADGTVVVGGWGAVFEDIEMRTISLVDIDLGESILSA